MGGPCSSGDGPILGGLGSTGQVPPHESWNGYKRLLEEVHNRSSVLSFGNVHSVSQVGGDAGNDSIYAWGGLGGRVFLVLFYVYDSIPQASGNFTGDGDPGANGGSSVGRVRVMGTFDFRGSFSGGGGSRPGIGDLSESGPGRPRNSYGVGTYAK